MADESSSGFGAALGDIGSSLASGVFGLSSARSARGWNRKMASSQYQRTARDLQLAGLNRVLAFGSPVSMPAAQVASMPDAHAGTSYQAGSSAKAQRGVAAETEKLAVEQQDAARAAAEASRAAASVAPSQAALNAANAKVAMENARAIRLQADKTAATNPLWKKGGEIVESAVEKGASVFDATVQSFKNLFSGFGAGDVNNAKPATSSAKKSSQSHKSDEMTRRIRGW